MKYDLKELEKEYGKKTEIQCVELAKKFNAEMIERGEQLVGLLWYLEKTRRYQKIQGYKGVSFKVFVWEVVHLTYNRYRELAYAYNWFPVEARELGPTVIQTVRERVGVTKLPKVLSEIKQRVAETKNPEKKREVMEQIIDRHSPEPKSRVTAVEDRKAYWKTKYEEEHALRLKEKAAYEKEIDGLRERLARQEMPVKAFLAMKEAAQTHLQA